MRRPRTEEHRLIHPAIAAIERRRKAAGLSIREIEARAELGHSTYAKLVNGTTGEPKLPLIEAVAAAFDWPLAELLGVGTADALRLYPQQLVPSPLNPRRNADSEAIETLALSIDQHGLLQNLVVRPMTEAEAAERARSTDELGNLLPLYWIVAGERRWRALTWLESKGRWPIPALPDGRVPCRLAPAASALDPEEEHRVLALLENLQREDLSPLDAGRAFQALQQRGWSTASLAQAVHKTDRYVQQRLALLNLTPQAQEALDGETITFSQARALARANPSEQPELLELISEGHLVTEHEIDEHAKYLGRAHAGDTGNGKVQLDNPAAGSGGGAAPTQFMKDAAADYLAKHPEGYQGPGSEGAGEEDEAEAKPRPEFVPPVLIEEELPFPADLVGRLKPAIEALLPARAEDGDELVLGHPDLPHRLELLACLWGYRTPTGWQIDQPHGVEDEDFAAFAAQALELGLQVMHRAIAAEYGPAFDAVAGLQLDRLSSIECRLLAADAIELVRCQLRHEAIRSSSAADVDWPQEAAARDAALRQEQKLTRKVLALAESQPAAAPAPAPAPAPLNEDDDRLLDIPPILRRA